METTFYITLSIKTPDGYESYGKFHIGNDKKFAYSVFSQLKGNTEINKDNILCLDLMETKEALPVNIKMLSCTLQEMAENCKIITKEIFKFVNLSGH